MGSVYMIITTEYHSNHWDIVPCNLNDLVLYENDQATLHNNSFSSVGTQKYDDDSQEDNNEEGKNDI